MLHFSRAKQNKHQNDDETLPELYLYMDHKVARNRPIHPSKDIRAELDDDISSMRRHFRHSVKKLKRDLYYSNWLKNAPEEDRVLARARLRSRHA